MNSADLSKFFLARFSAWGASSISNVLIPLLVLQITGSSALVGVGMLIQWAPRLIIPTFGLPYLLKSDPAKTYVIVEKVRMIAFFILFLIASDFSSEIQNSIKFPIVWISSAVILTGSTILLLLMSGALSKLEGGDGAMVLQAKIRRCDFSSALFTIPIVGLLVYKFDSFAPAFLLAIPLLMISLNSSSGFSAKSWDKNSSTSLKTLDESSGLLEFLKQSVMIPTKPFQEKRTLQLYTLITLLNIPAFIVFYTYPDFLEHKTTGFSHSYANPESDFFQTQIRVLESFVGVIVASCVVRFALFKENAIFISSFLYVFGFILVHSMAMTVEQKLFLTMVWISGYFMSMICWRSRLHVNTCPTRRMEATSATLTVDTASPLLAGLALSLNSGMAASWICLVGFLLILRPVCKRQAKTKYEKTLAVN